MTTKDRRFLPSLAIALAAHAVLLLLLSRALAHQVYEAPAAALEVQVAPTSPAAAVAPGRPARAAAPRAAEKPAAAAPAAPPPAQPAPVEAAPPPAPVQPAQPLPAPVEPPVSTPPAAQPSDESAAALPPPPAAAVAAAPAASSAAGGTPSGTAGVDTSGGGTGIESVEDGGGTGNGTYKADIDPMLMGTLQVAYPAAARRLGQQGTVRVLVEVGADGTVVSVKVYVTSGYSRLDSAALDAVRQAPFVPARKGGRPVAARILVPVTFRLTN